MNQQTPVYLDCNATTPVDPRVAELVLRFMVEEFGNAGSRTHEYGARAKKAVQQARAQVAKVVGAQPDDVTFTSGATEANNIALLGLADWAERSGKRHIIGSAIEHKAVLEPLEALAKRGFDVQLVAPRQDGRVDAAAIGGALREDTCLVSLMHANNETGVIQPIGEVASLLGSHSAFFHVDAAQTFGKLDGLENSRIDMISISGHKIFGPKGVGALVARRRGFSRPPLAPLMFGGGQERGLRPGTLPVALIAGLGLAAELAVQERRERFEACLRFRSALLAGLEQLAPVFNGDLGNTMSHVVNVSFAGVDSEAAMVALKNVVAISNGSACTSADYRPSHVLTAMGLDGERVASALRLSWSHLTTAVAWPHAVALLSALRR